MTRPRRLLGCDGGHDLAHGLAHSLDALQSVQILVGRHHRAGGVEDEHGVVGTGGGDVILGDDMRYRREYQNSEEYERRKRQFSAGQCGVDASCRRAVRQGTPAASAMARGPAPQAMRLISRALAMSITET